MQKGEEKKEQNPNRNVFKEKVRVCIVGKIRLFMPNLV